MAAIVLVSLCAVGASTLSASAAQGSSSNPALVGAPVGAGAPGVCSLNGTDLDLFIRAANNTTYWKESPDGTTWTSNETPLGGYLTSAPAANVTANGYMCVFARGGDGALWWTYTTDNGASWSYWNSLSGQLATNTGPTVCSWGAGRLDVFVQGTDGALWWKYTTDNGTSWSYWTSLGGKLTSAPAATSTGPSPNQIGVFVAGGNGVVYYKHYTSSSGWSGWANVGGQVLSGTSPAAYNWGTTQIGWFVTGTDSNLYRNWVGSSSGYEGIAGVLTSSPSCTAKQSGVIDVFARGSTGAFAALYQISYNYPANSGTWGVWTAIGGV